MSRRQDLVLLLIGCCFIAAVCGSGTKINDERAALIQAAIDEAKEHASKLQSTATQSIAVQRQSAFKLASAKTLAQGRARVLFEDMVHRAEKKILQSRRKANAASLEKNSEALAEALATELLHTPGSLVSKEEIARMYQESECEETVHFPDCSDQSKIEYRTADGTCNNLNNPTYGAANTRFRRLISPQYEDGISSPRGWMQSTGSSLFAGPFSPPNPSPRVVSVGVVQDRPEVEERYTHILMQWGQFMDHDLDLAPEFENCSEGCTDDETLTCAPFPVPFDDENIMVTRVDADSRACHSFRRSLPACNEAAPSELSFREQINAITAYIDASQVYHHTDEVMNDLIRDRSSGKGLLRTGPPVPGTTQPTLPYVNESEIVACPEPLHPDECYLAGDARVNEQTGLLVMHTMWMREHNRIATALGTLNPNWDGEKIFQEARKIVGAEIQKITYKDYLPLVIGNGPPPLITDYAGYIDQVIPNIPNAFATAAYRFGHSQIQPFFDRLDENYNALPQGQLQLVDAFFNPSRLVESGGTDPILRGLVTRQARFVDEFINNILTNQLFAMSSSAPGLDLASLNIQRGRDHGLPPYLTWKRWALEKCEIESDFRNELTEIHLLQTYGTLETVDLFVGGLAEEPLEGGLVGATFACIFAVTFQSVRDGDRFYYENADEATGIFTAEQRAEIEKASLSRVICDNSDNIQEIQSNAFLANQDRVSCTQLPQINLNAWSEGATELPELCYAKIGVTDNTYFWISHTFDSLSAFLSSLEFHYSQRTISTNAASGCLSIRCPQPSRNVDVTIYRFSYFSSCSIESNPNLPASALDSFGLYAQFLDTSHVSDANGIYLSESSCNAGSVNAVDFTCSSWQTGRRQDVKAGKQDEDKMLIQSLEQMLDTQQDTADNVDKEVTTSDPVFTNAPKEVQDFLQHNANGSPTVGSNEKLMSVMENILQELKAQKNSNANEEMISELSETLSHN